MKANERQDYEKYKLRSTEGKIIKNGESFYKVDHSYKYWSEEDMLIAWLIEKKWRKELFKIFK